MATMRNYAAILAKRVGRLVYEHASGSQSRFAKIVGLKQPVISRILREEMTNPTLDTLRGLTEPFHLTPDWLLRDDEADKAKEVEGIRQVIREELARAEPPDGPRAELVALLPALDDSQVSLYLEMAREHLRTLERAGSGAMPQRQKKNQGK